ncbi:alpha/beta hydrolase family protein [Streptomyces collinus]
MTITPVTTTDVTRRRLLAAALVTGLGAAVPISAARQARAAPTAPGPSQLTLPVPTGPHPVGTVPLHLVDTSRPDPAAGPGRHRELMASVWYPARMTKDLPRAPWMTQGALRAILADVGFPLDPALGPLTAAHVGAPVHQTGRRLPVLVYSHGAGGHRGDHTIMVQELASHGYAVVTVDHTYDAFSEFPDGRLTVPAQVPPFLGPRDFATDIRFVLDTVEAMAAGHHPDADGRPLPQGLLGALDPQRIGAFGWSKGGGGAGRWAAQPSMPSRWQLTSSRQKGDGTLRWEAQCSRAGSASGSGSRASIASTSGAAMTSSNWLSRILCAWVRSEVISSAIWSTV